jgi:putative transposase
MRQPPRERHQRRDADGFCQYSLTFHTDLGHELFTSHEVIDVVFAQILRAASEQWFAVIAYCFMPDHLDLLVDGRSERSNCREFVATAKRYSGAFYAHRFGSRLWQAHDFARVIRDHALTHAAARHILLNPVRAGLVARVEDYPFAGSLTHTLQELLDARYTCTP